MKRSTLIILLAFLSFPNFSAALEKKSEPKVPKSYQERLNRFQNIISKQSGRRGRIQKAVELSKDRKSEFRVDALNLLAAAKPKEALPDLYAIVKDPDIREFAIYTIGEIPSERSIPVLIPYLDDPNENVR